LQIPHQADLKVILAFYHMTLFALTPLMKADSYISGIPMPIRNVNSYRLDSQLICQRRRSHTVH